MITASELKGQKGNIICTMNNFANKLLRVRSLRQESCGYLDIEILKRALMQDSLDIIGEITIAVVVACGGAKKVPTYTILVLLYLHFLVLRDCGFHYFLRAVLRSTRG